MDRDDLSSAHMHAVLVGTHNCCEWMGSPMDREAFMISPQMDTMATNTQGNAIGSPVDREALTDFITSRSDTSAAQWNKSLHIHLFFS